jgi:hypothetical protein
MADFDLVFRARRAVTAAGEGPAYIAVAGETIAAVEPLPARLASLTGRQTVELADDVVLLPGGPGRGCTSCIWPAGRRSTRSAPPARPGCASALRRALIT